MTEPGSYRLRSGEFLRCVVCGGGRFTHGHAQLNRALSTWFGLDWLDPTAHLAICEGCGHVHWFMQPPGGEPAPFTRNSLWRGESGEGASKPG